MVKGLRALGLEPSYRTATSQLARDFYEPCLRVATFYKRAAGYFTSSSLSATASGLERFVQSEGKIQLVVSPQLTEEDTQAIVDGYEKRDVVASALERVLRASEMPDAEKSRLELLAWLVETGRLDIKVALVKHAGGIGIYHEKFGIFEDGSGDRVAFSGSANESAGGLISNFESIDVYRSWLTEDEARAIERSEQFDALWEGSTESLDVWEFPEAAKRRLLQLAPPSGKLPRIVEDEIESEFDPGHDTQSELFPSPKPPVDLELRDYQSRAIEAWFDNGAQGIWQMATGTGKTITALSAVTRVSAKATEAEIPLLVVVVCPLQHLVKQWQAECESFGIDPILCFQSSQTWRLRLANALRALRFRSGGTCVLITTNSTLSGEPFKEAISDWDGAFLIVVDEVHNAGSTKMLSALPEDADYRLGLSATPDRWMDEQGSNGIVDYFGEVAFEFGLASAVEKGFLTQYKYFPVEVPLEDDESEQYLEISHAIASLAASDEILGGAEGMSEDLKMLLFKRARLIGGARNKIGALREAIAPFRDQGHCLVYCSDGSTNPLDGEEPTPDSKQLEQVVKMLGRDLKMHVNSYTHNDSIVRREELREQFTDGNLQALVAIRCLDEGVDIPDTKRAFILASSTNPRQSIQRRGRVLRKADGKDFAEVYDFLVTPPQSSVDEKVFEVERRLARRELLRASEFATTALNGPQASNQISRIAEKFHLLDIL